MRAIDDRRPSPAIPDRLNLADHVLWAGGASDDKVALVLLRATGAERWSYGRLREAVMRTAGGLLATGLTPGARVLMRIGNTPDFPVTYLGAIAAGLVAVPTAAALGAEEITKVARVLAPDAIVSDGTVPLPDHDAPILLPATLAKTDALARPAETGANDPAYVVFTSGTSGTPSGVVHAHRAILARGLMTEGWYGLTPSDRVLHAGAFNWTFTLGTGLMDPWAAGATALVLAPGTGPEMIPLLALRHEATMIAGAPGVFRRLLKAGMPVLPRLRHGLVAGEKLPETVRGAWRDATGTELHEAFGQSEISTFISGSPGRPAPEGTLGYTQAGPLRRDPLGGRDTRRTRRGRRHRHPRQRSGPDAGDARRAAGGPPDGRMVHHRRPGPDAGGWRHRVPRPHRRHPDGGGLSRLADRGRSGDAASPRHRGGSRRRLPHHARDDGDRASLHRPRTP